MDVQNIGPQPINNLQEISQQYDFFLVDIVGVVADGYQPFPQAISCLQFLQSTKPVVFLSNTPRPGALTKQKLITWGLNDQTEVFTSGDAVRCDLEGKFFGKKIYHLGQERNQDICKDMPIGLVSEITAADMVLLSQFVEQNENIDQFDELFKAMVAQKIPIICANPDKVAMQGKTWRHCAGTLAQRLENMGARVEYYGKPNHRIYDLMFEKYNIDTALRKRTLMIGDTLETDIAGAQEQGIDSLLVLSGNTAADIQKNQQSPGAYLKAYGIKHCLQPQWLMPFLQ